MKNDEFYYGEIKSRLTEKRFIHSLNVADKAAELAEIYGADVKKAYTAGLVHDILKDSPKPWLREYIITHSESPDPILLTQPALWHSVAGAEFLKNELFCDDEEILAAVRYHTSGRAGMSLLEKIVFVADFVSADRDYPGVEDMRKAAAVSLRDAMEEGLNFTIKELCSRRKPIYIDTAAAYNEVVMQRLADEKEESL